MESPVQIGEILASKYRVEKVLGAGAMGVVVAARHMQLWSPVALKFMLPQALRVHGATDRFLREARAAARLRGEHVARVSDFGTLDSGAPYIVMDLLEGADLEAVVAARGPLPIGEALHYVLDVCEGIDEAHQAGIVHRDLKPKNLFLTLRPNGTPLVKVLDFGISKLTGGSEDHHTTSTKTGAILGSPAFMAPEQIKNAKQVDARADIYAIGAVTFYLVTRGFPFDAESIRELFGSVLYKEPRLLRSLRRDAPASLEAVISRCLQKDPNARYSNVRELATALRAVSTPALADTVGEHYHAASSPNAFAAGTGSTLGHVSLSARDTGSPKPAWVRPAVIVGLLLIATVFIGSAGVLLHYRVKSDAPTISRQLPSAEPPPVESERLAEPERSAAEARDAGTAPSPPVEAHEADRVSSPPRIDAGSPRRHTRESPPPAASLRHGALYDDGLVSAPKP